MSGKPDEQQQEQQSAEATAQAAAVAQAAADEGANQQQTQAAAVEAAVGAGLSRKDAETLADALIDRMEQRGLFDHQSPPTASAQAGAATEENGNSTEGSTVAAPSAEPEQTPPRPKRSFAERFVGRR